MITSGVGRSHRWWIWRLTILVGTKKLRGDGLVPQLECHLARFLAPNRVFVSFGEADEASTLYVWWESLSWWP